MKFNQKDKKLLEAIHEYYWNTISQAEVVSKIRNLFGANRNGTRKKRTKDH